MGEEVETLPSERSRMSVAREWNPVVPRVVKFVWLSENSCTSSKLTLQSHPNSATLPEDFLLFGRFYIIPKSPENHFEMGDELELLWIERFLIGFHDQKSFKEGLNCAVLAMADLLLARNRIDDDFYLDHLLSTFFPQGTPKSDWLVGFTNCVLSMPSRELYIELVDFKEVSESNVQMDICWLMCIETVGPNFETEVFARVVQGLTGPWSMGHEGTVDLFRRNSVEEREDAMIALFLGAILRYLELLDVQQAGGGSVTGVESQDPSGDGESGDGPSVMSHHSVTESVEAATECTRRTGNCSTLRYPPWEHESCCHEFHSSC